ADLGLLYAAARAPRAAVPPYAGSGLPPELPGRYRGDEQTTIAAPLRVTGSIGVTPGSTRVEGPGTTPTATGADIAGTLDGSASFDVDIRAGQQLHLDLDARPWLDPRTLDPRILVPPAASWRDWARSRPDI